LNFGIFLKTVTINLQFPGGHVTGGNNSNFVAAKGKGKKEGTPFVGHYKCILADLITGMDKILNSYFLTWVKISGCKIL